MHIKVIPHFSLLCPELDIYSSILFPINAHYSLSNAHLGLASQTDPTVLFNTR